MRTLKSFHLFQKILQHVPMDNDSHNEHKKMLQMQQNILIYLSLNLLNSYKPKQCMIYDMLFTLNPNHRIVVLPFLHLSQSSLVFRITVVALRLLHECFSFFPQGKTCDQVSSLKGESCKMCITSLTRIPYICAEHVNETLTSPAATSTMNSAILKVMYL